jgi:NADPH-dependent curcumin reductase CurA
LSIGDVIEADATAEVLASNDPAIVPGTIVLAKAGWQTHAIVPASAIDQSDLRRIPEITALAVLGTPALTAYSGLAQIGKPQPGETLVVPAALGAVGAMVGQFGRIAGAWTVGIVSGPDEVAFALNELGFNAAVDHTLPDFPSRLAETCPDGIDVYFETIGGALWHMILPLLNVGARVVLSGTPAQYNHDYGGAAQYQHPSTLQWLVNNQGTIGAIQPSKTSFAEFVSVVEEGVKTGAIRHRIHILEGLEHAAGAWLTAIDGPNYGGRIVQVN